MSFGGIETRPSPKNNKRYHKSANFADKEEKKEDSENQSRDPDSSSKHDPPRALTFNEQIAVSKQNYIDQLTMKKPETKQPKQESEDKYI